MREEFKFLCESVSRVGRTFPHNRGFRVTFSSTEDPENTMTVVTDNGDWSVGKMYVLSVERQVENRPLS